MSLNISTANNRLDDGLPAANLAPVTVAPDGATPEPTRRSQLAEDLTNELTSWNPREMVFAISRMHRESLSLIHLNVLTLLEVDGPMSMGRLAELLDVSVASATGIVGRMEARGLVERRHDDQDRRVVLVQRTDAGANVFRDMDERRRAGLLRILERLTDDELAGFLAGHRALRAARANYVRELESETAATAAAAQSTKDPSR